MFSWLQSSFRNITSVYFLANSWNFGAITLQGPHLQNTRNIMLLKWKRMPSPTNQPHHCRRNERECNQNKLKPHFFTAAKKKNSKKISKKILYSHFTITMIVFHDKNVQVISQLCHCQPSRPSLAQKGFLHLWLVFVL